MRINGFTRFKINGLNIEKLLNKLSAENIPLYNVTRKQYKRLCFEVSCNHSEKVIACLENLCYNYTKAEDFGIYPFFGFLFKRVGLITGILFFLTAIIASTRFVYDIKVYGCKTIDPTEVIRSVTEAGTVKKSFKKADGDSIERTIYASFDSVAFVSASYSGLDLVVKIVETDKTPEVIGTEPCDLVSSFKGKISRLIVYQGTALVGVGDSVEKGQTIIGGYRINPEDGSQIPVKAMGEAYGIIELDYSETFESVQIVKCRSGRVETIRHIELFGMNFPQKTPNIAYNSYEVETESSYIFLNNFLPARLVTESYYETENVAIEQDFDKAKKILIEEAEKKARQEAEKQGSITELITTVEDKDGVKYINIKVFAEKTLFYNGDS